MICTLGASLLILKIIYAIPGSYCPEVSLASQPILVGEWAPGQ